MPGWVHEYQRTWLRGDLLAGVTVTAYLVPQVMAYAELAGLPAVAGLWAAVGALRCYALLGSSRRLSVGPESTTALMTAAALGSVPAAATDPASFAAALALLVVAGFCVLGWLGQSRRPRGPVVPPGARRLPGRHRRHHGRLPAGQAAGHPGRRRRLPPRAQRTVLGSSTDVHVPSVVLGLVTLAAMLVASAFFPEAPVALLGMLGATAVAWRCSTCPTAASRSSAGSPRASRHRASRTSAQPTSGAARAGARRRASSATPTTS